MFLFSSERRILNLKSSLVKYTNNIKNFFEGKLESMMTSVSVRGLVDQLYCEGENVVT